MFPSSREKKRWLPAKNIGTKTIPGYAVCALDIMDGGGFWAVEMDKGSLVYRVTLPNVLAAAAEDPALLFINGPTAIPPGKNGHVTQDYPAQVLHDGGWDWLPNGIPCGPVSGEPAVWMGRGPFTCMSHDPARALVHGGLHTVIVSVNQRNALTFAETRAGGNACEPGEEIRLGSLQVAPGWNEDPSYTLENAITDPLIYAATTTRLGNWGGFNLPYTLDGVARPNTRFEVRKAGLYWVSFSATAHSDEETEGASIIATLMKRQNTTSYTADWQTAGLSEPHFAATGLTGWRVHHLDTSGDDDGYPEQDTVIPKENICFSGPLAIDQGEQLAVKNASTIEATWASARLSLTRIAPLLRFDARLLQAAWQDSGNPFTGLINSSGRI
jgi:hypothetical protein